MAMEKEVAVVHPEGEQELAVVGGANQISTVDTFGGMIHVKWDETAAVLYFFLRTYMTLKAAIQEQVELVSSWYC